MVNIWPSIGRSLGSGCPLCGMPGDAICARCAAHLPRGGPRCVVCAVPLDAATDGTPLTCADCLRDPPAFDRVVAPLLYVAPVDRLVAAFKDHHRLAIGRMLAEVLAGSIGRRAPGLLVPVPIARERLRGRGFNQAAELARQLSATLRIPWDGLLARTGPARDQRGLNRRQRRRNVRDAFTCTGRPPAHVALIDDVVTTAATADAAARALKRAGAGRVEVWAVARTPPGR